MSIEKHQLESVRRLLAAAHCSDIPENEKAVIWTAFLQVEKAILLMEKRENAALP